MKGEDKKMKKTIVIAMALVLVAAFLVTPVFAAKPGTDFNGPHYNLNLIGKAKTMPGDYNNPDRHTMFVPLDTSGMDIPLNTPNNLGQTTLPGIKIKMTQGTEFAVLDGNATDGEGSFQLGPGRYNVYIAVKAKSPKYVDPHTNITGWVEAYDDVGDLWYYINVGSVQVKKSNSWTDATGLFFVNTTEDTFDFLTGAEADYIPDLGMWVFDYMAGLDAWVTDLYDLSQLAYFWQFDNYGNKLIQVRFYPMN